MSEFSTSGLSLSGKEQKVKDSITVLALSLILIAYNVILSLLPNRVQTIVYVPLNLVATGFLLFWAQRGAGLSLEELGFGGKTMLTSALWGALVGLVVGGLAFAVMILFEPQFLLRVPAEFHSSGVLDLLYRVGVRIPLGTVVLEEIAFRGVLFQLFLRVSRTNQAVALQSLVFALWHVGLLLRGLSVSTPTVSSMLLTFLGVTTGTFLGGALLGLLRTQTSSLVGSMVTHWVINALVTVALSRRP